MASVRTSIPHHRDLLPLRDLPANALECTHQKRTATSLIAAL